MKAAPRAALLALVQPRTAPHPRAPRAPFRSCSPCLAALPSSPPPPPPPAAASWLLLALCCTSWCGARQSQCHDIVRAHRRRDTIFRQRQVLPSVEVTDRARCDPLRGRHRERVREGERQVDRETQRRTFAIPSSAHVAAIVCVPFSHEFTKPTTVPLRLSGPAHTWRHWVMSGCGSGTKLGIFGSRGGFAVGALAKQYGRFTAFFHPGSGH
jgi:hypothetical protein